MAHVVSIREEVAAGCRGRSSCRGCRGRDHGRAGSCQEGQAGRCGQGCSRRQEARRRRSKPWPRQVSPASASESDRPVSGGRARQSRPRVSVDPAQRGVHGHRPHRPARGRCGAEPALPGRYRNLPHCRARGGPGQAGDVYEPERACGGRSGSRSLKRTRRRTCS